MQYKIIVGKVSTTKNSLYELLRNGPLPPYIEINEINKVDKMALLR